MDPIALLNTALAGRYEVERELGAGGMATVFLAHDVRHHRHVALKLLKSGLGAVVGPERFLEEIRVTARLQHPNLVPLFDSGDAGSGLDGPLLFYVMPYIEGESLRARLTRERQLPVEEAVRIGVAVASALEYAHQHGVVHRDLKPENILLQAGQPMVADFGIALALSKAGGARVTQTGISLGTPQYMSPEQAAGDRVIDSRSDIYSLAAVVYEMFAGDPPHSGSTAQAVISRVLTERPHGVRNARASVPEYVEATLDRALEKLPADRFATVREFADGLEGLVAPRRMTARDRTPPRADRMVRALSAGLVVTAALAVWGWLHGSRSEAAPAARFHVVTPAASRFVEPAPAISPDGRLLVYTSADSTGQSWIWLRPLDRLTATRLSGTEQATFPFWSPRGDAVGFFSQGKLKIARLSGEPVQVVADAPRAFGGSWSVEDSILFAPDLRAPLSIVHANGGAVRRVGAHRTITGNRSFPNFLPDGRHFLYLSFGAEAAGDGIYLGNLAEPSGTRLRSFSNYSVTSDRYLLFTEEGVLRAQLIDLDDRSLAGPSVALVGDIAEPPEGDWPSVSVSRSGVIAYRSGALASKQLTWVDRSGRILARAGAPGNIFAPALSPDETKVSYGLDRNIWIADLTRPGTPTRLTADSTSAYYPVWSPDGRQIAFTSVRTGAPELYVRLASGAGEEKRLVGGIGAVEWTIDGCSRC